ncbi:MAG: radical SAM family heme chaperone HemW [Leptospiraceae bacterium]|nr:radical SAM family heme chaperone HemW [Leptospiraceae bacterium]
MILQALGVYVHLPFCDVKCAYCDFYSIARRHVDEDVWQRYRARLLQELKEKSENLQGKPVSLFFGGGTPSKAPPYIIGDLIEAVAKLPGAQLKEVTMEANPESLQLQNLKQLKSYGLNRVSVGIQSTSAEILKYLGRIYNEKSYREVFEKLQNAGIHNYSADFILGTPGLKLEQVFKDLNWALQGQVKHISAYTLTVEPDTMLEAAIKSGRQRKSSDRRLWLHQIKVAEFLHERGFKQYEVSNYALKNYQSLHNQLYWKYRQYIGLGVSAHSFLNGKRTANVKSLEKYLNGTASLVETAKPEIDFFIGSLRLTGKQSLLQLKRLLGEQKYNDFMNIAQDLQRRNLIQIQNLHFQMTEKGLMNADQLLKEITDALAS